MVRFDMEEDFLAAVTGGPWRVFGSILMVQAWSPEFDPMRDEIATTPVWVRISNIPINFYHRAILMGIAEGVGKPIKVDLTTLKVERARFARVCVEVNLRKPLKGSLLINGERYFISYEGINTICFVCGLYGHVGSACPRRVPDQSVQKTQQEREASMNVTAKDSDGFTAVRRRGRPALTPKVVFSARGKEGVQSSKQLVVAGVAGSGSSQNENRFLSLVGAEENQAMQLETGAGEENKENVDTHNLQRNNGRAGQEKVVMKAVKGMGEKVKGSLKGVELEKKTAALKSGKHSGSRGKNLRINGPARGLVFGPVRGESGACSTGKRLRVDQGNVGRSGGAYVMGGVEEIREGSTTQIRGEIGVVVGAFPVGDMSFMEQENHETLSDGKGAAGGS